MAAGDQRDLAYTLVSGKTMVVAFDIRTTDVTAAPLTLNIAIPDGYVSAKGTRNMVYFIDAGAAGEIAIALVSAAGTVIALAKVNGAAWTTTAAGNTWAIGQIAFPIQ